MSARSASTKPPLPLNKTRAEVTIAKKKPTSIAKHKGIIHRSNSFSEQDESFSGAGSRSSSNDLQLCKDIEVGSNSAIINKLEREISELRKENNSLKKEITEVRTLYDQLINEHPSECFNERRVLVLKSQIIQLERQLLLFTNSLESHFTRLLDATNKVEDLIEELEKSLDSCTHVIACRKKSTSDKLVLTKERLLNQLGAIKKTINRPVQPLPDKIAQPLLFLNSFINPSVNDGCTCTLLDICCGRMDIINLKQVARLESKLAHLYQSLIELQSSLGVNLIVSENKKHLQERLDLAKSDLQQCCHDLLQLSLLVPSAPWPGFKKSWDEFGFTADSVISKLPPFTKNKKEGRDVIHGVVKAFTYAHHMLQSKCNALTKELSFYESVCKLQTDYIESFYNSVIIAYKKFDEDVQHFLSQPLKALLEAYNGLSQLPSDNALKHFLSVLHDNYDKLQVINDQLDGNASQGVEALLEFKKCFFDSLAVLQQQQEHKAEI